MKWFVQHYPNVGAARATWNTKYILIKTWQHLVNQVTIWFNYENEETVGKCWQRLAKRGISAKITQLPLGGTKHGVGGQLPRLPRHQPVHNQPGVHHTRTQPVKALLHHALKVRERTVLKLHKVRRRGFQSLRVVECTWTPQSSLWHKRITASHICVVLLLCLVLLFGITPSHRRTTAFVVAVVLLVLYQCSIKTREVLGNPSPMPWRFPETRKISWGRNPRDISRV